MIKWSKMSYNLQLPPTQIAVPLRNYSMTHDSKVLMNSMVTTAVTMTGYMLATTIFNQLIKRTFMQITGAVGGLTNMPTYLVNNISSLLGLPVRNSLTSSACCDMLMFLIIDLLPSSMRERAMTTVTMMSKIGAAFGNVLFPVLVTLGMVHPFIFLGFILIGFTIILPKARLKWSRNDSMEQ